MNSASLAISIISIVLSLYIAWKNYADEREKSEYDVLNVVSPDKLVSPKAGILYIEMVVTNKSKIPLVLTNSILKIQKTEFHTVDLTVNAYFIDTLISTHKEGSGSTTTREIQEKSNKLPITIPPKDVGHFIVAYPTPGIMGISKETTNISLSFENNRGTVKVVDESKIKDHMITMYDFLAERIRIA